MVYKILVASYSSQVYTLAFDPSTSPPTLALESSLEVGHRPSWITPHPTDETVVFTANEASNGIVKALKYDIKSGKGQIVAEASTDGADPCHLAILDNDLFIANYSGSSVAIFSLLPSFPYLPQRLSKIITFSGKGPVTSRQERSHPHQVMIHPNREEVLIPDLGADKMWRLEKESSQWVVKDQIDMPAGGGPRHSIVADGKLFTLLELSNHIACHNCPALPESSQLLQIANTLSNPPLNPTSIDPPPLSAEILSGPVTDECPTPYLYITNRNDPSPLGDILSIFELAHTGSVKLVKEIRTGLNHLRGIAFDKTGRYLVAGGAFGGGVKIFERQDKGMALLEIAHLKNIDKPTGFHWLPMIE